MQPLACAGTLVKTPLTTGDANAIVAVAQDFTGQLFEGEQPAITTAVAHLPPETQALAQAAYAALQKAIDAALAKGVTDLSSKDQVKAKSALVALNQASDVLHDALHADGDPILAPILPGDANLQLPGAPNVPTITIP